MILSESAKVLQGFDTVAQIYRGDKVRLTFLRFEVLALEKF